MRIYLDNCCYNRPYDDLSQLTVSLEAQAKLYIQSKIKSGEYELATSEVLRFEVANCPAEVRRSVINEEGAIGGECKVITPFSIPLYMCL